MILRYLLFLSIAVGAVQCAKEETVNIDYNTLTENKIPDHFPAINYPDGNNFTPDRWALGKKLFYDKRLSINYTISCADCHKQEIGFADNKALTPGVFLREASRNAPSLANVGYHPYFTREGGVPSLEMQILIPISEHNEFDFNMVQLIDRLSSDTLYQKLAFKAYGRTLDAFSITRAISTFERSLISANSKFDLVSKNQSTFTALESMGRDLFFSEKTNCSHCHNDFNFTNYTFQNNGLYTEYKDTGRFRLTGKESDLAMFKVPSLRLVGITAPYMHDGSVKNLKDVVEHYNSGGKNHANKSKFIRPLNLSETEKSALVAFLLTLNDDQFIKNKYFSQ